MVAAKIYLVICDRATQTHSQEQEPSTHTTQSIGSREKSVDALYLA